jgi:hypothetical protein
MEEKTIRYADNMTEHKNSQNNRLKSGKRINR